MTRSVVLLLLVSTVAAGQRFRRQPPPIIPGEGANFAMICTHPVAVRELKLDDEQIAALKKLVDDIRKDPIFYPGNRDGVEEQRQKFLQQQRERRKQISDANEQAKKLLSEDQRKRAKQLLFQYNLQTRRIEAALNSIGETLEPQQREELEVILSTIPVVVSAKFAEFNYRMVARSVDDLTPKTPSKKLMGKMFRFINERNDGPVDLERHRIKETLGRNKEPRKTKRYSQ